MNEINGKDHLGLRRTRVPTIFGMNFQAVSVAQKLVEKSNNTRGGYLDAAGTPSQALLGEIKFVDASIAKFVEELKERHLYDSTLIVITAKTPDADRSNSLQPHPEHRHFTSNSAFERGLHSRL